MTARGDHARRMRPRRGPPARSARHPDREASASARRQGRVAKAAWPRPRGQGRVTTAASPPPVPPPVRRMRLLKLRAPTMPPEAIPIRAPPGPRSFSERASPRPRRQGRAAKAASPPPAPPPRRHRPHHRPCHRRVATARPPPVRRMRLLKLRAPTMPPEAIPIRSPPGPRSFSERASPRRVGKAASPRPRHQGRVATARPPPAPPPVPRPCRRPSAACAC
jgi:hypothetical protein